MRFRVWDTVKKAMSEVQAIVYTEEKVYPVYFKVVRRYVPFSEAVLMQSTGLFDNSTPKKEIFEGDVVRFHTPQLTTIGVVVFDKLEACFKVRNDFGGHWVTVFHTRYFEVLGNVYEHNHLLNPELLEELK